MNESQKITGNWPPGSLILFDDSCPLCRNLAALITRKATPGLDFASWQSFTGKTDEKPEALGLWDGQNLLMGPPAWEALLKKHPSLGLLNWAAGRLKLTKQTASALSTTSLFVRKICTRCGTAPGNQHR